MYIPQFVYPSMDGHLGCFYLLAVVTSAAMSMHIHVFVELLDHVVIQTNFMIQVFFNSFGFHCMNKSNFLTE